MMYQMCASLSPFRSFLAFFEEGMGVLRNQWVLGKRVDRSRARLALHTPDEGVQPCVTSCAAGRLRAAGVQLSLPDGQI